MLIIQIGLTIYQILLALANLNGDEGAIQMVQKHFVWLCDVILDSQTPY